MSEVLSETKVVILNSREVEIPVEWEIEKIGDVAEKTKGTKPNRLYEEPGSDRLPYLTISASRDEVSQWAQADDGKRVPENQILIVWDGASSGTVFKSTDGIIGSTLASLAFDGKDFDNEFAYYFLRYSEDRISSLAEGTGISHVPRDFTDIFQILKPPLSEQQRIADILSTVDENIQQTNELIEETKNLKRGITQDLMSKGINHNSFEERRLGPIEANIPSAWDIVSLSEICTEVRNGFVGSATQHYTEGEEGVPYLQSNNVRRNKMDTDEVVKISEEFDEENPQTRVHTGDLLTVQSGHIGETCVVNNQFDGANSHAIIISRVKSGVAHPEFVSHFINSEVGRRAINAIAVGSTVKHINVTDFRKFKIPLPSLEEQRKIGDILNKVTDKINEERRRENKLKELKRGLMQDLLTGKVRVDAD